MPDMDDVLQAVRAGDVARLRALPPETIARPDSDGRTALMHAILAESPSLEVIRALIGQGIDVNAVDRAEHWTALHFAARDNRLAIVQALLEAGARVDAQDTWGNTPLWRSVMDGSSDPAVAAELIRWGANPRLANHKGVSALDLALRSGRTHLAEIMTTTGADS